MINLKTEKSPIITKTEELCQTILEQPVYAEIKQKIHSFSTDEEAQDQYRNVMNLQNELQQKQAEGQSISDEEINEFESMKKLLFENDIAKEFIDVQQEIHQVQETIHQYVVKTFELGRIPEDEDFEKGACGPNCGCH